MKKMLIALVVIVVLAMCFSGCTKENKSSDGTPNAYTYGSFRQGE